MFCLKKPIDFLYILPFMRPLISDQLELSKYAFYIQDGGKMGAYKNRRFGK